MQSVTARIVLAFANIALLQNIKHLHGGNLCIIFCGRFIEGGFISPFYLPISSRGDTGDDTIQLIWGCHTLLIFVFYLFHHRRYQFH